MTDNTKQKLKSFINLDSWQSKGVLDMERFYEFIVEAYNSGDTSISEDEFLEVVGPFHKMNEHEVKEWIGRFENGIELLKVYNKTANY